MDVRMSDLKSNLLTLIHEDPDIFKALMHRLAKPMSQAVASETSFVKAAVKSVSAQIFEEQASIAKAVGAASASGKRMSEEEVFEIMDDNEQAFGFPNEMSESIEISWESNVLKFMAENFKSCIPGSNLPWYLCNDSSLNKLSTQHFKLLCRLLASVFHADVEWCKLLKENSDTILVRGSSAPPLQSSMILWIENDPRPRLAMTRILGQEYKKLRTRLGNNDYKKQLRFEQKHGEKAKELAKEKGVHLMERIKRPRKSRSNNDSKDSDSSRVGSDQNSSEAGGETGESAAATNVLTYTTDASNSRFCIPPTSTTPNTLSLVDPVPSSPSAISACPSVMSNHGTPTPTAIPNFVSSSATPTVTPTRINSTNSGDSGTPAPTSSATSSRRRRTPPVSSTTTPSVAPNRRPDAPTPTSPPVPDEAPSIRDSKGSVEHGEGVARARKTAVPPQAVSSVSSNQQYVTHAPSASATSVHGEASTRAAPWLQTGNGAGEKAGKRQRPPKPPKRSTKGDSERAPARARKRSEKRSESEEAEESPELEKTHKTFIEAPTLPIPHCIRKMYGSEWNYRQAMERGLERFANCSVEVEASSTTKVTRSWILRGSDSESELTPSEELEASSHSEGYIPNQRSSSDDSANASRKRKKADPRFSGIGFASSDEERINRERDKGRRGSAVGAAGGDDKKVARVTRQKKNDDREM